MGWRRWAKVYVKAVWAGSFVLALPVLIIGVPLVLVLLTQAEGDLDIMILSGAELAGALIFVIMPVALAAAVFGAPITVLLHRSGRTSLPNFAIMGGVTGLALPILVCLPEMNATVVALAGLGGLVGSVTGSAWAREMVTPAASRSTRR